MSAERQRRMYVTSVSSNTVVLSPEAFGLDAPGAGLGITQVTVKTRESTAEATLWGATGSCGRYDVIIRRVG